MFSTFHARISERFCKMIYTSFPSPTTHEEAWLYNYEKKGSRASMTNLGCLGKRRWVEMWRSWVERRAWVDLEQGPSHVSRLQETKPSFGTCSSLLLCSLNRCNPPLVSHIFFPLGTGSQIISGFPLNSPQRKWWEEVQQGCRLWKSCPWREHLHNQTFKSPC